jgi:hypothetical protein
MIVVTMEVILEETQVIKRVINFLMGVVIGASIALALKVNAHDKKDHVIISVLLTYLRDNHGHNLNPDKLYEDGLKWIDDPKYNAVKYPR